MPELPEVEFCRRALARWTAGRRVVDVVVEDPRSVRATRTSRPRDGRVDGEAALRQVVINALPGEPMRHGKRLLWPFGEGALLLHLGMTGKWTRRPTKFPKVRFVLAAVGGVDALGTGGGCEGAGADGDGAGADGDGAGGWNVITFSDPRLLGGVVPCSLAAGMEMLHHGLGPDALREPLPALAGRRPVKVALMDQGVVAGLGNLHAAEALWRAGIDPRTPAGDVRGRRHAALASAVQEQLRGEIASFEQEDEITYIEDAGADNPFPVYGQAGANCPRCSGTIERFEQAGRSTYWCPGCQRG